MNFSLQTLSTQFSRAYTENVAACLYDAEQNRSDTNLVSKTTDAINQCFQNAGEVLAQVRKCFTKTRDSKKLASDIEEINQVQSSLSELVTNCLNDVSKSQAIQRIKEPFEKVGKTLAEIAKQADDYTKRDFLINLMQRSSKATLRILVNAGFDINSTFPDSLPMIGGYTPLTYIISNWNEADLEDQIRFLVGELGADINLADQDWTPLEAASARGINSIEKLLIKLGAKEQVTS